MMQRIADDWCDPTGDRLVADMDAAGIERSVVFVLDFALHGGVDDGVSLERRYELFAAAVSRHPDRLVLYGGIDPRRPDAAAFVRRAEHEFGIRGVKIWPPAGRCPMTPGRIACMSAARSSGCRWWCTRGRRSARSEASARG